MLAILNLNKKNKSKVYFFFTLFFFFFYCNHEKNKNVTVTFRDALILFMGYSAVWEISVTSVKSNEIHIKVNLLP